MSPELGADYFSSTWPEVLERTPFREEAMIWGSSSYWRRGQEKGSASKKQFQPKRNITGHTEKRGTESQCSLIKG